jgi:hypothetical protein
LNDVAQDRDKWRAHANAVMHLIPGISIVVEKLLASQELCPCDLVISHFQ